MADLVLHPQRDRSVRRRHPWLLSGAVARVEGNPEPGAWVRVVSAEGESLGFGHFSPHSQIRVRLLSFGKEAPDDGLIAQRIAEALRRREGDPLLAQTDAVRLVNAEGDGLPGLIADRYDDVVVVKLSTAGMNARRELVAEALRCGSGAGLGFERADGPAARREGISARQGPLWGQAPQGPVSIREGERRYQVDVVNGQKTGFYLDQRDGRALVESLARERNMLDLFAYTGGFAVAAAHGGAAAVTLVDSSGESLGLAQRNLEPYGEGTAIGVSRADVFRFLRRDERRYDLLVLDPPPLARRASDRLRASRAHKDLLLFALRRAAPGALVLAFSCSHHVDPDLWRKIVFAASLDAGRPVQELRGLGAPSDHPVSVDHPEGRYLQGTLLRA
jgi:23S rRNA (cytosine1962-C5)-methyltransferase